jgi:Molybdopterin-binding domain of aldehyde dehydrogenase
MREEARKTGPLPLPGRKRLEKAVRTTAHSAVAPAFSRRAHRVHRFWAAVDAGLVIQPRNLAAQVEGGIVLGVSAATE